MPLPLHILLIKYITTTQIPSLNTAFMGFWHIPQRFCGYSAIILNTIFWFLFPTDALTCILFWYTHHSYFISILLKFLFSPKHCQNLKCWISFPSAAKSNILYFPSSYICSSVLWDIISISFNLCDLCKLWTQFLSLPSPSSYFTWICSSPQTMFLDMHFSFFMPPFLLSFLPDNNTERSQETGKHLLAPSCSLLLWFLLSVKPKHEKHCSINFKTEHI